MLEVISRLLLIVFIASIILVVCIEVRKQVLRNQDNFYRVVSPVIEKPFDFLELFK